MNREYRIDFTIHFEGNSNFYAYSYMNLYEESADDAERKAEYALERMVEQYQSRFPNGYAKGAKFQGYSRNGIWRESKEFDEIFAIYYKIERVRVIPHGITWF